jgi:hypothetical protein
MAVEPFRFSLEPELVAAEAEHDEAERALRRAKREAEEQVRTVAAAETARDRAAQQTLAARDHRRQRTQEVLLHDELILLDAAIEEARAAERTAADRLDRERGVLRAKEHQVLNLRRKIDELDGARKGLERMRAAEHAIWRKAAEAARQKALEDDALSSWQHRARRKDDSR